MKRKRRPIRKPVKLRLDVHAALRSHSDANHQEMGYIADVAIMKHLKDLNRKRK